MTTEEVAEFLRVDQETIRRLYKTKALTGFRVGRGGRSPLRFRRSDVDAYLERQKGK